MSAPPNSAALGDFPGTATAVSTQRHQPAKARNPSAPRTRISAGRRRWGSKMTVTASKYERRENDLYETPEWVTRALLRHFPVQKHWRILEPAAGNHKIADVLREAGAGVITLDIKTYDRPHDFEQDFLTFNLGRADAIITNPPYGLQNRLAVWFVEHALASTDGMVAMLLTAKFDFGKTRRRLFSDSTRFAAKINLIDRISWTGDGVTGTEDHAWYVWGPEPVIRQRPVLLYAGRDE